MSKLKLRPQKALPQQPDSAWWYESKGRIEIYMEIRLPDGSKKIVSAHIRRAALADYILRSKP